MTHNNTNNQLPNDERTIEATFVTICALIFILICTIKMHYSYLTVINNGNFTSFTTYLQGSESGLAFIEVFPPLGKLDKSLTANIINNMLYLPVFLSLLLIAGFSSHTISPKNTACKFVVELLGPFAFISILMFSFYFAIMGILTDGFVRVVIASIVIMLFLAIKSVERGNYVRLRFSIIELVIALFSVCFLVYLRFNHGIAGRLTILNEMLSGNIFALLLSLAGIYNLNKTFDIFKRNVSNNNIQSKIIKILFSISFSSLVIFLFLIPSTHVINLERTVLLISTNLAFYLYELSNADTATN